MLFVRIFVCAGNCVVVVASGTGDSGAGVARWTAGVRTSGSRRANSLFWKLPVGVSAGVYEVAARICQRAEADECGR